ncbi:hypothetical protein EDB83DRAFT_2323608 [Lactarius deliciosus]|nr:hypothetical protein EDB83DRAFT_2323608 [Lactarius deliciosus]
MSHEGFCPSGGPSMMELMADHYALVRQHGLEGVTCQIFKADHGAERGAGSIAVGVLDPGGEPSQMEGLIGWVVANVMGMGLEGDVAMKLATALARVEEAFWRQGGTWAEIGQDAVQVRANFRGGLADRQGWGGARGWSEDEARPHGDFHSGSKGGGGGQGVWWGL